MCAKNDFMSLINSTVSHEMRNPLNSIINCCRQMKSMIESVQTNVDTNIKEICEIYKIHKIKELRPVIYKQRKIKKKLKELDDQVRIMSSSAHMLKFLVEDILDLAQINAGKFRKNIKKFDVRLAVDEVTDILMFQASGKRIKIITEFIGFETLGQHDFMIFSDMKRLQQVIMNLKSNALKFTPEGGKIWITVHKIDKN